MKTTEELTSLFVHTKAKIDLYLSGGEISIDEVICSTTQALASVRDITGIPDDESMEIAYTLMDSEEARQRFYRRYGIKSAFAIA